MQPRITTPTGCCRVAVQRADITPSVGFYHRMWGAATHEQATGVHRPLFATVLALGSMEAASSPVVIAALDHCLMWARECFEFRRAVCEIAGLSDEQLLVTFSHTHAAGLLDPSRHDRPGGEWIAPYLQQLADTVGPLARDAVQSMVPATLTYGMGSCAMAAHRDAWDEASHQWVCGLNVDGAVDQSVVVIRIDDEQHRSLATVVNYGCHPTTLAWANTLISPDYPGAMRDVVETATNAPCLFLLGACGDVGPRVGFVGDVAVADQNGRQLGYAALATRSGMPPSRSDYVYRGPVISGATLGEWEYAASQSDRVTAWNQFSLRRFSVPLAYRADRPVMADLLAEREACERTKLQAIAKGDEVGARDQHALIERLSRAVTRWGGCPPGETFPYQVALLRIGEAVWVFVESEPYQWLQTELRRRFPQFVLVIVVLFDGWRCSYLPRAEDYGTGVYPDVIAMLARGCLEQLVEAIAKELVSLP